MMCSAAFEARETSAPSWKTAGAALGRARRDRRADLVYTTNYNAPRPPRSYGLLKADLRHLTAARRMQEQCLSSNSSKHPTSISLFAVPRCSYGLLKTDLRHLPALRESKKVPGKGGGGRWRTYTWYCLQVRQGFCMLPPRGRGWGWRPYTWYCLRVGRGFCKSSHLSSGQERRNTWRACT